MDKFVIFVCGIALMVIGIQAGSIPVEFEEPAKAAHKICFDETDMDDETHAKIGAGNFEDDDKCYFKCVFGQFGLIDDNTINFDTMRDIIPDSIREKGTIAVDNCRATTGTDLCDQSYNVVKCFYNEDPEEFFIV